MLRLLNHLRIKTLAAALAVLLLCAGAIVVGSAYQALQEVETVQRTWVEFTTGPARKTAILAELRDALGIGG